MYKWTLRYLHVTEPYMTEPSSYLHVTEPYTTIPSSYIYLRITKPYMTAPRSSYLSVTEPLHEATFKPLNLAFVLHNNKYVLTMGTLK